MNREDAMHDRRAQPSILVVDDDPTQREALVRLAGELGLVAFSADDGALALRACAQLQPDAVLLDYHMPGLDGDAVVRQLREHERGDRRPIVGISASLGAEGILRWEAAGIDAFLPKPIDAATLAGILRRWLPIPAALLDRAILSTLAGVNLVERLLPRFVEALTAGCAELLAALEAGDLNAAGSLAHRLRGASAQLGATRMAALLAEIEGAIDDGEPGRLPAPLAALEATRSATIATIEVTLAARRSR